MDANLERFQAAGLPPLATESVSRWDDLLMHGRFSDSTARSSFAIDSLTGEQYRVFVALVESYFLAGYEYFAPAALKAEDRNRMTSRFGG